MEEKFPKKDVSVAVKGEAKNGYVTVVRYDRSFISRIIQSDGAKTYYAELKNACRSLGMKSRISWENEIFCVGQKTLAILCMHAGKLYLSLALDPKDYEDVVNYQKDMDTQTNAECPMTILLKNDLSLNIAKTLVKDLAVQEGLEEHAVIGKISAEELPYEDTDALVLKGLIHETEFLMTEQEAARAIAQEDGAEAEEEAEEIPLELADEPAEEVAFDIAEEEHAEEVSFDLADEDEAEAVDFDIAEEGEAETVDFDLAEEEEEADAVDFDLADEEEEEEGATESSDDEAEEVLFELSDGGLVKEIRYDKSFTARVIQSEAAKKYYSEIKNYCARFPVKSRISWKADTFHVGWTTYAIAKVRGKSLALYLALDPTMFDKDVYHQRNVGDRKSYEKCPMMVWVRSDLALRKAQKLICFMLTQAGFTENEEAENVDYVAAYPYEDTDALVARNLIKKIERTLNKEESAKAIADDLLGSDGQDDDTEFELVGELPAAVADGSESYAAMGQDGRYVTLKKYTRGFLAKMKQGPHDRKDQYAAIKSEMLAMKGVRVSNSFAGETFMCGRQPLLKARIRGKTLCLFFALNPEDYRQTLYHQQNKGDVKAYADTPMMVRVKSYQGLDRALRLIEELMRRYSLGRVEKRSFRDEFRFEDTETLVGEGLIKAKMVTVPYYEALELLQKKSK